MGGTRNCNHPMDCFSDIHFKDPWFFITNAICELSCVLRDMSRSQPLGHHPPRVCVRI